MFISDFKQMIQSLPTEDAGHEALMNHMRTDAVTKPAADFFTRITNYALEKTQAQTSVYTNTRMLVAAVIIKRFPVETLITPERPLQFTLLNKAGNMLETVERILAEHDPAEDDTAPDLIPINTAVLYLAALSGYTAAWAEWCESDVQDMQEELNTALARAQSDVGPEMIFGEEE